MQRYQSHKIVEAGRITAFERKANDDCYNISVEGDTAVIGVTQEVGDRILKMADLAGTTVNGGHLVQYLDDYTSWSPHGVFEDGYDLVQPSSGKSKIAGYRELDELEINKMNGVKRLGATLGELVSIMRENPDNDQRWVSIGATDLQKGLMALTRAIAKPDFF